MSAVIVAVARGSPSIPESILPLLLVAPDADSNSLQDHGAALKDDWAACLKREGFVLAEGSVDYHQIQALSAAITRFLLKTSGNNIEIDTMKVPQIIARMCEYAGAVFQTCFGPPSITREVSGEKEDVVLAKGESDGCRLCDVNLLPLKADEIRESSGLEVFPYDEAFHRLQGELRELERQANTLHLRLEGFAADNDELQLQLDTLDDRMTHRLARARARYIRHIARLDEEWLMDSETIEQNELPCAECAENRARKPRLSYPSPASVAPSAAGRAVVGK